MSLFSNPTLTCESCGHVYSIDAVESINADRRPDYREAILGNQFQDMVCPNCGYSFRLAPLFSYLDVGHGQWIACWPAPRMPEYRAAEAEATELFNKTYGPEAPAAAHELGAGLSPRVTFGWPAVREKLLIGELGLNDVVLEMMKLDLLRRLPEAPVQTGVELRLIERQDERLRLRWLNAQDESMISQISVGTELYDAIAADETGWAEIRAMLTDGPFVDMQKTYMG